MDMETHRATTPYGLGERREPALINKNGLLEMGVYLVELQLTPGEPKDGVWRMPAIHAGGYFFAASDQDYADGPITVRDAGYIVIRHLKASRLTLADFRAPSRRPNLFGRMVGGRGGAYCDRPKGVTTPDAANADAARQPESRRNV